MRNNNKIDGIFNYCDRWCERCAFVQRCSVGIQDSELSDEEQDMNNEVFWKKIGESFAQAMTLLRTDAEKKGINLEMSEEETKEYEQNEKKIKKAIKSNDLMKMSEGYAKDTNIWMKSMTPFLEDKRDEFIQFFEMGAYSEQEVMEKAGKIKEGLDVIMWYFFFIPAKMNRALRGKIEDDGWELENGYQRDFDGSAKIAMIAAERSLGAWAQLTESLPDKLDDMLPMMANLQKIIRLAEQEFPEARKFVRPGFDEQ
jgi:hypothetical protein